MKALTIRQPWASLIVSGEKDIENRNWKTKFRGRVVIHSSAKREPADTRLAFDILKKLTPSLDILDFLERVEKMPLGCVLGTANIVDCVESSDSPWFQGGYGSVLCSASKLAEPIPCKGHLSFWTVPDVTVPDVIAKQILQDGYALRAMGQGAGQNE